MGRMVGAITTEEVAPRSDNPWSEMTHKVMLTDEITKSVNLILSKVKSVDLITDVCDIEQYWEDERCNNE